MRRAAIRRLAAAVFLVAIYHAAAFVVAALQGRSGWSEGYLFYYPTWRISVGEALSEIYLLVFVLAAIALASMGLGDLWGGRVHRTFDSLGAVARASWWPIVPAMIFFALAMSVRFGVLDAIPISDDEFAYGFEARLIASGHLYAESAPAAVRAFFDNQLMVNNGRWFAVYFIGHSAVLALASVIGVRPAIGPLLSASTLLLGIGIARRVGGERVAVIAGTLMALSPFFVFTSATELSEPTSALCMTLVLYAALRIEDEPSLVRWWCVMAGAAAFGVLARPQTAIMYPLPVLLRLTFVWWTGRLGRPFTGPAAAAAILALGAATVLAVNHALTGSVWRTSQMAYFEQGAVWEYPLGISATLDQIASSVWRLNFWLFGWPLSLAFLPFFRPHGRAWMLAAVVAAVVIGYGLFAVPMMMTVGPIYYTELVIPLAVLSASGIERLVVRLRGRFDDGLPARAMSLAPAVACFAAAVTFVPVQIASLLRMTPISRAPYDLVEAEGEAPAIVFVRRSRDNPLIDDLPSRRVRPGSWILFHRNPAPDLSDRVLFVRDLGERNADLLAYLPGRAAFRLGMRDGRLELARLDGTVVRSMTFE